MPNSCGPQSAEDKMNQKGTRKRRSWPVTTVDSWALLHDTLHPSMQQDVRVQRWAGQASQLQRECPPVAEQEGGEAHRSGQEVHSLALELWSGRRERHWLEGRVPWSWRRREMQMDGLAIPVCMFSSDRPYFEL